MKRNQIDRTILLSAFIDEMKEIRSMSGRQSLTNVRSKDTSSNEFHSQMSKKLNEIFSPLVIHHPRMNHFSFLFFFFLNNDLVIHLYRLFLFDKSS